MSIIKRTTSSFFRLLLLGFFRAASIALSKALRLLSSGVTFSSFSGVGGCRSFARSLSFLSPSILTLFGFRTLFPSISCPSGSSSSSLIRFFFFSRLPSFTFLPSASPDFFLLPALRVRAISSSMSTKGRSSKATVVGSKSANSPSSTSESSDSLSDGPLSSLSISNGGFAARAGGASRSSEIALSKFPAASPASGSGVVGRESRSESDIVIEFEWRWII